LGCLCRLKENSAFQTNLNSFTLHRFNMAIPEQSLSINGHSIEQLIEHMLAARQISRQDQDVFMSVLLAKRNLTEWERSQVNRIYDALRTGRLRVVE
jgi:hypothetical protein